MIKRCTIAVFCALMSAQAAQAGAWLRDPGRSFVSSSITATQAGDGSSSTYLEYGLNDRLTLGADVFFAFDRFGNQGGYGTLFLRLPLGSTDRPNKWAIDVGGGAAWLGGEVLPHLKTGLSWGRGYRLRQRAGWIAVDASVFWDLTYSRHVAKLDTTVGLALGDHVKAMMQVFYASVDGVGTTTYAPSLLIEPGRGTYSLQVGVELPADDYGDPSLKLGVWRRF